MLSGVVHKWVKKLVLKNFVYLYKYTDNSLSFQNKNNEKVCHIEYPYIPKTLIFIKIKNINIFVDTCCIILRGKLSYKCIKRLLI